MARHGNRRHQQTGMVMKPQAKAPTLPGACIYPFATLSTEQGYPSADDFIVSSNDPRNINVRAQRHFQRITRMCRISGQLMHHRQPHTVQLAPGIHVYDPYFCGHLPHACDPNAFLDMSELWMWALQDISPGALLSIDYVNTEARLLRQFACQCGSPRCRGWITGYDEPPSSEGMLYLQGWRRTAPVKQGPGAF